ncbi:hypothetical protein JCM33374_g449 [Metschnikowia sp. JCM 33374]|nr:hypothetical protein JCM33374_g449 [Metschnikowia sp. JCM 33374]
MSFWSENKNTFKSAGIATVKGLGTGTKAISKAGYNTYKKNDAARKGLPPPGQNMNQPPPPSGPSTPLMDKDRLLSLPAPPRRNVPANPVPGRGEVSAQSTSTARSLHSSGDHGGPQNHPQSGPSVTNQVNPNMPLPQQGTYIQPDQTTQPPQLPPQQYHQPHQPAPLPERPSQSIPQQGSVPAFNRAPMPLPQPEQPEKPAQMTQISAPAPSAPGGTSFPVQPQVNPQLQSQIPPPTPPQIAPQVEVPTPSQVQPPAPPRAQPTISEQPDAPVKKVPKPAPDASMFAPPPVHKNRGASDTQHSSSRPSSRPRTAPSSAGVPPPSLPSRNASAASSVHGDIPPGPPGHPDLALPPPGEPTYSSPSQIRGDRCFQIWASSTKTGGRPNLQGKPKAGPIKAAVRPNVPPPPKRADETPDNQISRTNSVASSGVAPHPPRPLSANSTTSVPPPNPNEANTSTKPKKIPPPKPAKLQRGDIEQPSTPKELSRQNTIETVAPSVVQKSSIPSAPNFAAEIARLKSKKSDPVEMQEDDAPIKPSRPVKPIKADILSSKNISPEPIVAPDSTKEISDKPTKPAKPQKPPKPSKPATILSAGSISLEKADSATSTPAKPSPKPLVLPFEVQPQSTKLPGFRVPVKDQFNHDTIEQSSQAHSEENSAGTANSKPLTIPIKGEHLADPQNRHLVPGFRVPVKGQFHHNEGAREPDSTKEGDDSKREVKKSNSDVEQVSRVSDPQPLVVPLSRESADHQTVNPRLPGFRVPVKGQFNHPPVPQSRDSSLGSAVDEMKARFQESPGAPAPRKPAVRPSLNDSLSEEQNSRSARATPPPAPPSRNSKISTRVLSDSSAASPPPPPPTRNYSRVPAQELPTARSKPDLDLELSTGWFANVTSPLVLPDALSGLNYSTTYQTSTRTFPGGTIHESMRSIDVRFKDLSRAIYNIKWSNENFSGAGVELVKFVPSPIENNAPTKKELMEYSEKFGNYVASWCLHREGQKVGTGECWDLARDALAKGCGKHAFVSQYYHHGYPVLELAGTSSGASVSRGPEDEIRVGDILQFKSAILHYKDTGVTQSVGSPDHTAVVYEKERDVVRVLEQNVQGVKIVRKGEYILGNMTSGSVFYLFHIYFLFKMPTTEAHAPVLSTPQDDSAFTYAKVNKAEIKRTHLHLKEGDNYISKLHEYYSLDELAQFLGQQETGENGESLKYKRVTLQFPDQLICDSASIVQELQKKLKLSTEYSLMSSEKSQILGSPVASAEADSNCASGCATSCSDESAKDSCSSKASCSSKTSCSNTKTAGNTDPTQRLWILADTSYSACCIDEVAAQHVNADLVVHFGDACLNPVACLPSAYVFGKPQLDLEHLASEFKSRYPLDSFKDQKIVVMADAPHTYLLQDLADRLSEYQIVVTDLTLSDKYSQIIGYQPEACEDANLRVLGRVFKGVEVEDNDDTILGEYELFHIGLPEAPRLLQLTTKFSSVTTFHDNQVSQGPYPNLMRRYRYMHMARSAGTVGILVNTLSLANTKLLVNQLAKKIKDAGKKHYIFVVGKPNVAKLANFEAVDMWCVLGCDHQGIILDQTSEYFKPIVTPYELILAIGDDFSWTGKWVTDFRNVLQEMGDEEAEEEEQKQQENDYNSTALEDQESDEEPEFNPVTGQYTSSARPLRRLQHLRVTMAENEEPEDGESAGKEGGSSGALVKKLSGAVALRGTVSTSAAHLQNREWTGLGSDWTDDVDEDGAAVEEGGSGIARGYAFDVENRRTISKLPSVPLPPLGVNDVALVTGGSCGLGLEMVKSLVSEYKLQRVYILDIVEPKADLGTAVHFIKCDLSSAKDVEGALTKVYSDCNALGRPLSVVVNNAGMRLSGSLLTMKPEAIHKVFDVNTFAPVSILQRVISHHIQNHSARRLSVVTISSVLGAFGARHLSAYSASKAAATQFHEVLSVEMADFPSVRMLLVTPGQLTTEMFKDLDHTRVFIAPLVDHVAFARSILKKVNIGEVGIMCEPFYSNFGYFMKVLPWKLQQTVRKFTQMDEKIKA